ncbi:MAG: hypothetical protein MUF15_09090 [Acidobacteria bacterium]|jgi:MGT family glycosyltransferase|nr:hypothetical protein [Acidobacteriota bacterium]
MATIVFFLDFQLGHIYPTFRLASGLIAKNHRVVYFGIPDVEQTVRQKGFEFYPIMADIYPLGCIEKLSRKQPGVSSDSSVYTLDAHLMPMMQQDILWPLVEAIQPDLIISSFFIIIEAMIIYLKTRLPQVIFIPYFMENSLEEILFYKLTHHPQQTAELYRFAEKQGFKLKSLGEFVTLIREFLGIIPCPKEFDLPNTLERKNIQYIGPSIRPPFHRQTFNWSTIPSDAKIIFASLGSQTQTGAYDTKKLRPFFNKMIEMMNSPLTRGWHLILSFGAIGGLGEIEPFPSSITALPWVPQIEILQKASLVITHGGLGTIKECIFYGVPMIVCPLVNDQPKNANRVTYHNLGKILDINSTTVENIIATIDHIMNSQVIQKSVKEMQRIFHHYEESHQGVKIIEAILEKHK